MKHTLCNTDSFFDIRVKTRDLAIATLLPITEATRTVRFLFCCILLFGGHEEHIILECSYCRFFLEGPWLGRRARTRQQLQTWSFFNFLFTSESSTYIAMSSTIESSKQTKTFNSARSKVILMWRVTVVTYDNDARSSSIYSQRTRPTIESLNPRSFWHKPLQGLPQQFRIAQAWNQLSSKWRVKSSLEENALPMKNGLKWKAWYG